MQTVLKTHLGNSHRTVEAVRWRRTAYRSAYIEVRDSLTGLYSREMHEEALVKSFKWAASRSAVLGIVFLELPAASDDIGFSDREQTLQSVARCLLTITRADDCVARHGPETFCITIVDSSAEAVRSLLMRCQREVQASLMGGVEEAPSLTLAGVCCLPNRNRCSFESFLQSADRVIASARSGPSPVFHSLLTEGEAEVLREIDRRHFSRFLSDRGLLPSAGSWRPIPSLQEKTPLIGRLARRLRWLRSRRLSRILREQRQTHEMFGDCAIRLGYLRSEQVYGLLALQRENPMELVRTLCEEGSLDEGSGRKLLAEYQAFLLGKSARS